MEPEGSLPHSQVPELLDCKRFIALDMHTELQAAYTRVCTVACSSGTNLTSYVLEGRGLFGRNIPSHHNDQTACNV